MNFFKILAGIVTWGGSLIVVYMQHVAFVEGSKKSDMFGVLIIIVVIFNIVRVIEKRITVWDIQDKHKVFILNWKNGKRILIVTLLTWVLFTVENNLIKIQNTSLMILACFIIGWILSLIGSLRQSKESPR